MKQTRKFIESLGFPSTDSYDLPTSSKRFPDGAQYRFEIPSVEGPRCLQTVIDEAKKHKLTIHRVSQGSGILLQTDDEIKEMLRIAKDQQMEVSLFVGPRATWDIGAQPLTPAGKNIGLGLRGMDQVVYAIEDIKRGCDLGLRGILVADLGLLWLVNEMKKAGKLPANLVVKISVQLSATNPIAVKILEDFGAGTFNVSSDQPLPLLASIRQAVSIPLDLYVESPDNFGGFIRHFEIPEFIRVLSPLYVKLGLRNAPDIYPSGTHIEPTAIALTKERVRRAKIAFDMIQRYCPEAVMSQSWSQRSGRAGSLTEHRGRCSDTAKRPKVMSVNPPRAKILCEDSTVDGLDALLDEEHWEAHICPVIRRWQTLASSLILQSGRPFSEVSAT